MRLDLVSSSILLAIGLKAIAFAITIYTVGSGLAVEIAPVASILSSLIGIVPAGALVNLISFMAMIFTLFFLQKRMEAGKLKQATTQLSLLLILITASSDAIWDALIVLNLNATTQASFFALGLLCLSILYVKMIYRRVVVTTVVPASSTSTQLV